MTRVYNFSPGPAMLPQEVMQQAQQEFLDWHGIGASVMEISHRGKYFSKIAEQTIADLRELLNIPENYHILFLPGGGRMQFCMAPMNFAFQNNKAAYLQTGVWSKIATMEAHRYAEVNLVSDTEDTKFTTIYEPETWQDFDDAAYLFYCDNETVNGVEFPYVPDNNEVPLICDMSSNLLSRPFDISQFGMVFACAQKNLGPSGITVAIVRDNLVKRKPHPATPSMMNYQNFVETNSMYNTPPTYPWYILGLVLQGIKKQGGVAKMADLCERKSQKLYDLINSSDFYLNHVDKNYRSRMNVVFNLADESLEEKFLTESEKAGLFALKGHRFVGGMRASLYLGMPEEGVDTLVEFMREFEKKA
jgi:phosphoserine aminotransferase